MQFKLNLKNRLILALFPEETLKINTGKSSFMQMENINSFLRIINLKGVPKQSLFAVSDLLEGTGMPKVLQTLHALQKLK